MHYVMVSGSREWTDYDRILFAFEDWQMFEDISSEDITLVHGGAVGADELAEKAANHLGWKVQAVYPEWDKYGRSAGFRRNITMLESHEYDMVFIFWNGLSRGTKHVYDYVCNHNLPHFTVIQ